MLVDFIHHCWEQDMELCIMFAKSGMKESNSEASGKKYYTSQDQYCTAAQIRNNTDMCFMEVLHIF